MEKNVLQRTIEKMKRSQEKKAEVIWYMQEHTPHLLWNEYKAKRIRECCNVLRFINYWEWKQKLFKSNFCKYDKLCLACATRRAIKKIQHFEQGIIENELQHKHWYHITLTIRHHKGHTLEFLIDRLMKLKKKLSQDVRNCNRKEQKKSNFFNQFSWMIASLEVTYWKKNWRHPHLHVLVCSDHHIDTEYSKALTTVSNRELQRERYNLTKDSYCVAMRKVDVSKEHFDRQWIAEVFKYAVKFSTLETPQLIELIALQKERQYRFYSTYWVFRWWKFDKNKTKTSKEIKKIETNYLDVIEYSDFEYDDSLWKYSKIYK